MISLQLETDITNQDIWPSNNKGAFTKFEAFIHVLLLIENLKEGCLVTISGLAKEWSWSRHKARDFLNYLANEKKISTQKKGSKILIEKVTKDTQTDSKTDTTKDTQNMQKQYAFIGHRDTRKDMSEDIQKDTKDDDFELPIDEDNILEILNM